MFLVANSGATGLNLNLLSLNTNTLLFTVSGQITLSFAPMPSGFRQMPGTSFILYAGVKQRSMGIIEHVPATAPNVFLRTVAIYDHPSGSQHVISDVRAVIENGLIRYLVVAYIGFQEAALTNANSGSFRVWTPPVTPAPAANAPVVVIPISCGANTISGCRTCGNGQNTNANKCESCVDGQGRIYYFTL